VCVHADVQVPSVDVLRLEDIEFLYKSQRIDDHAMSHDSCNVWAGDAGRHLVQLEYRIADLDRVAGIVSSLKAHNHVGALGQMIDDLAFSFIAPLGTDNYGYWHYTVLQIRDDARWGISPATEHPAYVIRISSLNALKCKTPPLSSHTPLRRRLCPLLLSL